MNNQCCIPPPPSKKWVTFDDLMDDAMESGKLTPRRKSSIDDDQVSMNLNSEIPEKTLRRSSISSAGSFKVESPIFSSSISSNESWNSPKRDLVQIREKKLSDGGIVPISKRNLHHQKQKIDFTQSLGSAQTSLAKLSLQKHFVNDQKKAFSEEKLPPSTTVCNQDKYSMAFDSVRNDNQLRSSQTGWSTKLRHGSLGIFGWSDEILRSPSKKPITTQSLDIENDSNWYDGLKSKWDTSPTRTFARNFP